MDAKIIALNEFRNRWSRERACSDAIVISESLDILRNNASALASLPEHLQTALRSISTAQNGGWHAYSVLLSDIERASREVAI